MFLRGEVSFADGFTDWITLRIIFSGCLKAVRGTPCKGCHNEELWSFNSPHGDMTSDIAKADFEDQLKEWKNNGVEFDGISVIGGEPLDQSDNEIDTVLALVEKYYKNLPIILYTGYSEEQVLQMEKEKKILKKCDYLKCGPYIEKMRTPETSEIRPFLGSVNQNLYKIEHNEQGEVISYIRR